MESFEAEPAAETETQKKQSIWEAKKREVEAITDRLGYPMDEGIIETVVAFWVNGFPTVSSCEGHFEEGEETETVKASPRVIAGFEVTGEGHVGEDGIKRMIADRLGLPLEEAERTTLFLSEYSSHIKGNDVPETPEHAEVVEKNGKIKHIISELLDAFYLERDTAEADRLMIKPLGDDGSFVLIAEKEEPEDEHELELQQQEMRDFGMVLKKRFFEA